MRPLLSAALAALAVSPQAARAEITLAGDEAPSVMAWTQPASVTYTDSSDSSRDSLALNAALKVSGRLYHANTWFVRGVAHVTDQDRKEQEVYKAQLGLHFEPLIGGTPNERGQRPDALSLFTDLSVGWNSTAQFADAASPACVANPGLAACSTQHQRSARLVADFQPFMKDWEETYSLIEQPDGKTRTSKDWAYSFAPHVALFHDEVTDAVLDESGLEEKGGVSGAVMVASAAVSPPVLDHRLIFRASYQYMLAFNRSNARAPSFDSNADLFTASVDYELGVRSWEGAGWAPSIGLSYSNGADPLNGRDDREDVSIALRLTFRGGS